MTRTPEQIFTAFSARSQLYFSSVRPRLLGGFLATAGDSHWLSGPGSEEAADDDSELLELPVNPDEGSDLIPDDERIVHVPS